MNLFLFLIVMVAFGIAGTLYAVLGVNWLMIGYGLHPAISFSVSALCFFGALKWSQYCRPFLIRYE